jgi:hypothetical protein
MSSIIEKAKNFAASKLGTLVAFTFTVLGVVLAIVGIVLWFIPSDTPEPTPRKPDNSQQRTMADCSPVIKDTKIDGSVTITCNDIAPPTKDRLANKNDEYYSNKIIRATGIGFAKNGESNYTIRYEMAKRAAEADAMRKLAERIHVVVESVTKVQNKRFSDEEITLMVKAILKSQRVINIKENNDGSVEVTMEAPINSISILTEDK